MTRSASSGRAQLNELAAGGPQKAALPSPCSDSRASTFAILRALLAPRARAGTRASLRVVSARTYSYIRSTCAALGFAAASCRVDAWMDPSHKHVFYLASAS